METYMANGKDNGLQTRQSGSLVFRLLLISIAALASIVALVKARSGRARSTSTQTVTDDRGTTEPDPASRTVGELREELAGVRNELGRLELTMAAARSATPSAPVEIPKAAAAQQSEAEAARVTASLAARIARETPDTIWSERTEGLVTRAISPASTPGTRLKSVVCKTSLCAIATISEDTHAKIELGRLLAREEPFASSAGYLFTDEGGGSLATTIYMLRRGSRPLD